MNLWYDGSGELEVAVSTPFGASTAYQPTLPPAVSAARIYRLASMARVQITTPGVNALNGDKAIRVALQSVSEVGVQPGRWFLHFRNSGAPVTVHGWTIDDSPWGDVTWVEPSNSHLIGAPGAASSCITAAASVSRDRWQTEDGSEWSVKYAVGDVSPTSSCGPLRNRDQSKPDFAAPGCMIISARSRNAVYDADGSVDSERAAMAGTSMSSALLAGICATILERHPDWDPIEMVEALKGCTRGTYTPQDGWGLVNLARFPVG
jgi:hypothetical protein